MCSTPILPSLEKKTVRQCRRVFEIESAGHFKCEPYADLFTMPIINVRRILLYESANVAGLCKQTVRWFCCAGGFERVSRGGYSLSSSVAPSLIILILSYVDN